MAISQIFKTLGFSLLCLVATTAPAQIPTLESDVDSVYLDESADEDAAYEVKKTLSKESEAYLNAPIQRRGFDSNSWQKAKEGLDYTVLKEKEKEKKQPEASSLDKLDWSGLITFLKWFFIIGAVVVVAYLILWFVGAGNVFGATSRRIGGPSVSLDLAHIEENLETIELDPHIKRAIDRKEYNLAVRLYYLAILKELSLSGAINWKKDKTNRLYVSEMRTNAHFPAFRKVTNLFERVWYGDTLIDEAIFTKIQPDFKNLLNLTRAKTTA